MQDADIKKLKSLLNKTNEEINSQYADSNGELKNLDELKIYPAFDTTSKTLDKEEFRPLEINGIKLDVSNLGRIRWNGIILHQVEKVKNLYSDNKTIKGFLQIDKEKHKDLWKKIPNGQYEYVYQLVAKVWLDKLQLYPKCEKYPIEIHHKDNNGYNNNVDNLINLIKYEHFEIHKK